MKHNRKKKCGKNKVASQRLPKFFSVGVERAE